MKVKYNFGLLKKQTIGFLVTKSGNGYHGTLVNVRKKGSIYHFLFADGNYIEISEVEFLGCEFRKINDIYYFIPKGNKTISGFMVFTMSDTFGFPMELTQEILEEKGYEVDLEGYQLMKEIQKRKNQNTFMHKNAF